MSTLFLRNPRLTVLVIGVISVAGLSSYIVLPRMEDPILTERAAFVRTILAGADAEQIESLVTEPIEDELRDIPEIKEIRSSSRNSMSTISVELRDDVTAREAPSLWSQIRDRISDAEASLPEGASRPRFEQIEITAYTRLIAIVWDQVDQQDELFPDAILRRRAEDLRELLLAVPGTKDVEIYGDPDEEIVVEIDGGELAALGLTAGQVSQIVSASDARVSAGLLRGDQSDLLIEVSGELNSVQRIASIPVLTSDGHRVVTLGDIAKIRRSVADPPSELAIVEGKPAVVLACLIRPSQRIDRWNRASENVTADFQAGLSKGLRLVDIFSQNGYVTDRLTELRDSLLLGAASVMMVILFLMGWRSAVIVGAALPLTAFMVFTGMRLLQIPVHQMSITGLIIALGLLIDNAIVVVDEVNQKLRSGVGRLDAVGRTVRHLAVPLFGSTFTTALAFTPIAVMPGPAGEFVGAIAVNVIVAIFSSLFLAMTVVPALTIFLGQAEDLPAGVRATSVVTEENSAWYQSGWKSRGLLSGYRKVLQAILARPMLGVIAGMALPFMGLIQSRLLPIQFFPPSDRDQVAVELELSVYAPLQETLRTTTRVRNMLLQQDGVTDVTWWLGRSAPSFYYNQIPSRRAQSQFAHALVKFDHATDLRNRVNRIQTLLDGEFSEARVIVRQLEQGPPFDSPIEVQVFGPDLNQLKSISNDVRAVLVTLPDVTHVRASVAETQPRLSIHIDEEEARLVGLTHQEVAMQMYGTLEGAIGGIVLEGTEELPVRIRVASAARKTTDQLEAVNFVPQRSSVGNGAVGVPLTAIGAIELQPEQPDILRQDRRRVSEVQAFLKAGVLPAVALAEFQSRFDDSGITLPPGYSIEFAGESAQRNDAVGNLMASVGVLAVLMGAALVLSFKSFRLAALVGLVAILAVGLGLGPLWFFGFPFGFMAIVGMMGLVGVAINDSIVVVAAIQEDELASQGDAEAILKVVIRSTRHVVATTVTTIAGFMPLILAGGSFWPPMAVTIAGGVGGATILALIFVPACYLLMRPRECDSTCPTLSLKSPHSQLGC